MKLGLYKAKSVLKVFAGVVGILGFLVVFFGGLFYLDSRDFDQNEQVICAPDKLYHVFSYHGIAHGVCQKSDGSFYLSPKTRK